MELLGFTPIQIKCGKGQLVLVKILYYGQFRNNQTLKNLLWVGLFFSQNMKPHKLKQILN